MSRPKKSADWPGKDQGKWSSEAQEITRRFYAWFNEYFSKRKEGTYEEER